MSLNNAQFSNVYSKPLKYAISEYHTTRCAAMHVFNASAGTYNAQRAGTIQVMLQFCNGLITRLMYLLWNGTGDPKSLFYSQTKLAKKKLQLIIA